MLRIILGLTGVGLIGFGLFGGQSLEVVHQKVIGIVGADSDLVVAAKAEDKPSAAETVDNLAEVAESAEPLTEDNQALAPVTKNTAEPAQSEVLAVAATDQRSLEIKTDTTTVKEVKASARDSELAIARSLLDSNSVALQGAKPDGLIETSVTAAQPSASGATQPAVDSKESAVNHVLKTTAGDSGNATLFVLKESVNLREGPSTDHSIVLRLDKGQELMEFKRDGKWVHVGAYGTSGKIGWVHTTLVGHTNL